MDENSILGVEFIEKLAPEHPVDQLPYIQETLRKSRRKLVILDDDPTGTQTSKDLPVLTEWGVAQLTEELKGDYPAFFILTNSRSMVSSEACRLAEEIGKNLKIAASDAGVDIRVVSRSDSTLRGHFPDEVDALAAALGKEDLPYLIAPFFLEGGRLTMGDIHYVREGDTLVPAAMTAFARDAAFGFSHSDLKLWIEEKTEGRIRAEEVISVSLEDIRKGGPQAVADILVTAPDRGACVINSVSYRDMEVVIAALFQAENNGREFLYRTAASFVRTANGVPADLGLLGRDELVSGSSHGGLFLIGSYVEKTSRQVEDLLSSTDIQGLVVQVERLFDPSGRKAEIERTIQLANQAIAEGNDIAIFTSRELVRGQSSEESLQIGTAVSNSLIEIARGIEVQPNYFVAKGGITSSDVATKGLGVKRAMVRGQVQPGVPVWELGGETRYPGMPYIVYPGNVGSETALSEIKRLLAREGR